MCCSDGFADFPAASQILALWDVQRGEGGITQSMRGGTGLTVHWAAATGEGLPVGFHSSAMSATNRYSSTFHNGVGGVSWGGLSQKGGLC